MPTVTATTKGQVVIPAPLRKKFNIKKGTKLFVSEEDGKIIMETISEDLVNSGRGMLRTRGKVLKRLMEDRESESF